jgi:hypothetical protein
MQDVSYINLCHHGQIITFTKLFLWERVLGIEPMTAQTKYTFFHWATLTVLSFHL